MRRLVLLIALALVSNSAFASAWTFRAAGAIGTSDNAAPASPAGLSVGDTVIITTWDVSGVNRTLSTPSGWTQLNYNNTAALDEYSFCRVWQMGDSMPTINWGFGDHVTMHAVAAYGPTGADCSTMLHASNKGTNGGAGVWIGGSITITHDNTWVILTDVKLNGCDGTGTTYGTITKPTTMATSSGTVTGSGAFTVMQSDSYTIQTTAANIAAANVTISGTQETCGMAWVMLSLERQDSTVPSFSSGPSYNTTSNTQITATFTANVAALSYYCGLWLPGATAPTAAEVAAGTNAHSAIATGTTTGSSEAHAITASDSPTLPIYDPYCVLYNGTTYTAVPTTTTTATSAPTGYQYVTLASVTATGSIPKAFNDADLITLDYDTQTANFTVGSVVVDSTSGAWGYIRLDSDSGASGTLTIDKRSGTFADNDVLYDQGGAAALVNGAESAYTSIATSDQLVRPTTLSPSSASLGVDTSGQYTYTATGRQSALDTLIYHAATMAYLSLKADPWFNNATPFCQSPKTVVYSHGSTIDYDLSALCDDADHDTLTYARITSLPAGATLDPSTGHVTGTVNTDATTAASFVVFDQAGDYVTQDVTFVVQTTWPMPNCSGLLTGVCANQILATTLSSVSLSISTQCSASAAAGYLISQSPAAGATIAPGDTVSLVDSVGNICSSRTPDCTSTPTTTGACEALYNATFSSLVSFAESSRCNNSTATGYVISTSPKANTEVPLNPNISIVSSLGTCSTSSKAMVNCISHTTAECLGLLQAQFGVSVTLNSVSSSCPTGYATGEIYSQAPASGKKTHTPAVLNVTYCQ